LNVPTLSSCTSVFAGFIDVTNELASSLQGWWFWVWSGGGYMVGQWAGLWNSHLIVPTTCSAISNCLLGRLAGHACAVMVAVYLLIVCGIF
jgi:hypothetical protein